MNRHINSSFDQVQSNWTHWKCSGCIWLISLIWFELSCLCCQSVITIVSLLDKKNMPTPSNTPSPTINRLAAMHANRPRIKIQIPPPNPQGNYFDARSPFLNTGHSNQTHFSNGAPQWPSSPYVNPFTSDKDSLKAGEYMFKQFGGIRDLTWDWTKSGLNKGEKSVIYLYDTISRWSRRWFTHMFLMTIVFLYSIAGAYIFVTVEGKF